MIQQAETLHAIAGIAIALMGFTGIVVVLGGRSGREWTPVETISVRTLLETSVTALFGSFLPILLAYVWESEGGVWRLSNALLAAGHLANMVAYLVRARRLPGVRVSTRRPGEAIALAIGIGFIFAHILTAAGALPWYVFIFVLGLLDQIFVAVHQFILLLIPRGEFAI